MVLINSEDFPKITSLNSAYFSIAGQEVKWLDTDNEDTYRLNMSDPQMKSLLLELKWDKLDITYKINQNGFRSPEFKKDEPNILFLGCSFTAGIGLRLKDTFSYIVSQNLGLQNYNLGVGGGSSKACFRLGEYWIPKLKPNIVVLLSPNPARTEIIVNEVPLQISVGEHFKSKAPELYSYYKTWITNEENWRLEYVAIQAALEKISKDVGALFIGLDNETDFKIQKTYFDKARDLQHPGRGAHKLTAKHILAKIHKA